MRRRDFIASAAGTLAAAALNANAIVAAEPASQKPVGENSAITTARGGDELQQAMDRCAVAGGGVIRLSPASSITCEVRQVTVAGETSACALLIPVGVELDLNGSTLLLDLRRSSYGIRLSNRSAIRNGTVRMIRSEGLVTPPEACQAIWHCPVTVGAAYGEGGTVAKPGYFTKVSHWSIEDLTIDQPFESSCIQLMSEACHGVIRNIRILDSEKAKIGVGLDWGSIGPVSAADAEIPAMRRLWEKNQISASNPHHVLIENIKIGKMGRKVANGVRCSGCHDITIRNIEIDTVSEGITLVGGDLGFEFSPDEQRQRAHAGYVVENVKVKAARLYGLCLSGAEDNVYRSRRDFGYDSIRNPVHPGLDKPIFRDVVLRGTQSPHSRGIYLCAITGATFENVDVEGFESGVAVNEWVPSLTFRNGRIAKNEKNIEIRGGSEIPPQIVFDHNADR